MDHARLNNPFPRAVPAAAIRNGDAAPRLSFAPTSKLVHAHDFPVGTRFRLRWDPSLGGEVSLSRVSSGDDACRTMWETVPGVAFLSAASVVTEADECRGSFAVRDGRARLVPHRQHVDKIRAFYRCDADAGADLLRGAAFQASDATRFPVLVITGLVSAKVSTPASCSCCGLRAGRRAAGRPALSARYWILLEEKTDTQVAFSVKIGDYQWTCTHADPAKSPPATATPTTTPRIHRPSLRLRLSARVQRPNSKKTRLTSNREEVSALLSAPERAEARPEEFNRVFVTYASSRDERFYGFGEQFSRMEFKGKRVPVLVQEQGIGRGDQPITFAANLVSYRSGGNWSTTYAPSPFYMTSKMRSLYLEGYDYSIFDLTKPDRVQIQIYGNSVQGRILDGDSPTQLLTSYTESTGRPPVLPRWITSGAVVGMQGGTDTVRRVWNQLQEYDVPVSAFWLQDWVGQRKTSIGSQLWWNWEVDDAHYNGWKDLVGDLGRSGIRTMTYCNPCLVLMDQKPNTKRHLFEEAKKLGILVRDEAGEPYMMPNTVFDVAMLDFTNPEAHAWFKKILRGMVDDGVSGWMADFGEGLPLDARLHSGEDPVAAHNRYPELWARVNREFADEWKAGNVPATAEEKDDGGIGSEDGLVFFVRSGFRESSRWAMLFWEGDQMVSWQANDGIKSSVVGLLSGGLSGFPLNHSDAGGYCTVDLPFLRYRRSEELLLRWMEVNAFTVVFRTHEGNKPGSNCQFYSSGRTLAHFARCAKLYKAWDFYRAQLVREAAATGLPVARHLFLHYPADERVQALTYQQFLVGTELLVVPVLDKGRSAVTAYFPAGAGAWRHVWTGDEYGAGTQGGFEAEVEARVGYPAVFTRAGSSVGERFVSNLRDLKIL
ncbi:Sulfoquinovosidase [Dichanthelium oligosanthes]|uniref:Sulfoquinovosidase n=1 Tax=Dichanthelium oligosanthes TaxID=888268 RepID=A0A1E5VGF7_9POAL|nr:Sulfoquinovosidase [Dichanthelium oligosanthes]